MAEKKEIKKKRAYRRKPVVEITADNYMEFSAKQLWQQIEKLQNQAGLAECKKENSLLKMKLKRIANIVIKDEE